MEHSITGKKGLLLLLLVTSALGQIPNTILFTPELTGRGQTGVALHETSMGLYLNPALVSSNPNIEGYLLKTALQLDHYFLPQWEFARKHWQALASNISEQKMLPEWIEQNAIKLPNTQGITQLGIGVVEYSRPGFAMSIWQNAMMGLNVRYTAASQQATVAYGYQQQTGLTLAVGRKIYESEIGEIASGLQLYYARNATRYPSELQSTSDFKKVVRQLSLPTILENTVWRNFFTSRWGMHVWLPKIKMGLGTVVQHLLSSQAGRTLAPRFDIGMVYQPSKNWDLLLDYGKASIPHAATQAVLRTGVQFKYRWLSLRAGYDGYQPSGGFSLTSRIFALHYSFSQCAPPLEFVTPKRWMHLIAVGFRFSSKIE